MLSCGRVALSASDRHIKTLHGPPCFFSWSHIHIALTLSTLLLKSTFNHGSAIFYPLRRSPRYHPRALSSRLQRIRCVCHTFYHSSCQLLTSRILHRRDLSDISDALEARGLDFTTRDVEAFVTYLEA